jgi:hypothetical protein
MKDQLMPKADFITSILRSFSVLQCYYFIRMPRMEELGANPYSARHCTRIFRHYYFYVKLTLCIKSFLKNGYKIDLHKKRFALFFRIRQTSECF